LAEKARRTTAEKEPRTNRNGKRGGVWVKFAADGKGIPVGTASGISHMFLCAGNVTADRFKPGTRATTHSLRGGRGLAGLKILEKEIEKPVKRAS